MAPPALPGTRYGRLQATKPTEIDRKSYGISHVWQQVPLHLVSFRAEVALPARALVRLGERLDAWIDERFPGARRLTEVPVVAPRTEGGYWKGTADLLLELPNGPVVVIDHKTSCVDHASSFELPAEYCAQLFAYREAFGAAGLVVSGLWVHFPLDGVAVTV